jgi:16S rRNA (cytosine1402-N4)-methyltransferase
MDKDDKLTAWDVVNTYSREQLKDILYKYGEEEFAPRIADNIIRVREESPINTTGELVEIIKNSMPKKALAVGGHPAKKTFQAIRIEVNGELEIIEPTVKSIVSLLVKGGRLSVITFHSLEDRLVKNAIADLSKGCTCPPGFPVCVCGRKPLVKAINKKPILPSEKELSENSRSKSAKLRIAEKL